EPASRLSTMGSVTALSPGQPKLGNCMKIALGQINPTVGALEANVDRMVAAAREAAAAGARLIVFTELSVTGYPPRDLVDKPSFVRRTQQQLERLAHETASLGIAVICGFVGESPEADGKRVTNS